MFLKCVCVEAMWHLIHSLATQCYSGNILATTQRQHKRQSYAWGWRSARLCAYFSCLVNMLPPVSSLLCSPSSSSSSSSSYSSSAFSTSSSSPSDYALSAPFNFRQEENILILQWFELLIPLNLLQKYNFKSSFVWPGIDDAMHIPTVVHMVHWVS